MALRAKGERPIYTVSEGRLHMRDMVRYAQEAARLRESCEREIREAVALKQPESELDLRVLLDGIVGSQSMETRQALMEAMMPEQFQNMENAARELAEKLKPEEMRELAQIAAAMDVEKLKAFVARQPEELRNKVYAAVGHQAA